MAEQDAPKPAHTAAAKDRSPQGQPLPRASSLVAHRPLVFVSSTREDLESERRAILTALQSLKLPHNSLESFGSHARPPLETCVKEVAECDIFVVILGHRYGSCPPGEHCSFTELEYIRAVEAGKSVLGYIKKDTVPVLPAYVEHSDEGTKRLADLKKRICEKHTVSFFGNDLELAIGITAALSRELYDREKDAVARAALLAERPVPAGAT